ncbi:Choline dehydrogenase [Candidatus Rhodobacter oscarellae]|uniref:Choline dehydrogenase n=1 Tax=Candidatus Rhodobacter oscarellae TaxID=1675527 RepID=A0A0J9E6J3_9RHOB|nr:choline dehydrogenase [Candidatus Rhodobacter lobularis]KMW58297.1 Choline dehydrogenase [Candidatus Rhodobacter lobularis]
MEFDYIIVGAGSAGCVLANRLSADPANRVLLLEAGPPDRALSLKIPAAMLSNLRSTRHNWAFQGEPEPALGGRRLQHDRGRTLGGSSSINGMVFIRGHALDFDGWQQAGCEGWSYADVLPYFKRAESSAAGEGTYRGGSGPVHAHWPAANSVLNRGFLQAGREAGYPITEDINGRVQEGFGPLESTRRNGERWSMARAYLDPARGRANLKIVTGALVQRLAFEGARVSGVHYLAAGRPVRAAAAREVILSAGAVGSPHIMMLSGIGPAEQLRDAGIAPCHDLPGVGQNLQDHPDFVMQFRCLQPVSLWPQTRLLGRVLAGMQWLLTRGGICASNHFDVVACMRSAPGVAYPDLQLTMSPLAVDNKTWAPLPGHAFQIHIGLMRAHSRGQITLRDADPASPPRIEVNYLQDPRDRELLRRGVALVRELVAQPAFADLCGAEIFPGSHVQSDADMDAAFNADIASQWHLSGTARMGAATDAGAVVDPQGCVHGVPGLRVVDASLMPQVTNGNTNSPTIMIAEKLSDAILGRPPLPREEVEVWQSPDYETQQR